MSLPEKPRYTEPCNHCGQCCREELCEVGELAFSGIGAPCPALRIRNGRALCGLVLTEEEFGMKPLLRDALAIGYGCSMPDADTSDEEIDRFHEISLSQARNRS